MLISEYIDTTWLNKLSSYYGLKQPLLNPNSLATPLEFEFSPSIPESNSKKRKISSPRKRSPRKFILPKNTRGIRPITTFFQKKK